MVYRVSMIACLVVLASGLVACIGAPSGESNQEVELASGAAALTARDNAVYYRLRPDLRRCAAPLCGGVYVARVNRSWTRCADGRYRRECYVATSEFPALPGTAWTAGGVLARGSIESREFEGFGDLGHFVATEVWRPATNDEPVGRFYRVTSTGIVCITSPCPSWHADKLNRHWHRNISGLDLSGIDASPEDLAAAQAALDSEAGVLVAARRSHVTGPAGRALGLRASQFYLPAVAEPSCDDVECEVGTHCELVEVQCITYPCPPAPACVPDVPREMCGDVLCPAGTHCQLMEMDCPSPPCEPKPVCVRENGGGGARACVVGGCSSELCGDQRLVSPCVFQPEFACYRGATCERQADGACGWTQTEELLSCLEDAADSSQPLDP